MEYKEHLSRSEQAEFAIRAGDIKRAKDLIAEEDLVENSSSLEWERRVFELTNLDLQLGQVGNALDRLDRYCESSKRSQITGSYGDVFEIRRLEVDIMKSIIGKDYLQRVRERFTGRSLISLPVSST